MELCELRIGVGIDTGRYGHHATFRRPDRQAAAEPLNFRESVDGYQQLAAVLSRPHRQHAYCQLHAHLDAAAVGRRTTRALPDPFQRRQTPT